MIFLLCKIYLELNFSFLIQLEGNPNTEPVSFGYVRISDDVAQHEGNSEN